MKKLKKISIIFLFAFSCIMCTTDENADVLEQESFETADSQTFLSDKELVKDARYIQLSQMNMNHIQNIENLDKAMDLMDRETLNADEVNELILALGFENQQAFEYFIEKQTEIVRALNENYDITSIANTDDGDCTLELIDCLTICINRIETLMTVCENIGGAIGEVCIERLQIRRLEWIAECLGRFVVCVQHAGL